MEFNNIEAKVIEAATVEAAQQQAQELDELQLAFVGGGNIIVTLG
jgi:hypothetical protein